MSLPDTVSDSLSRNDSIMQTNCCSSCSGGWMWSSEAVAWSHVVTRLVRGPAKSSKMRQLMVVRWIHRQQLRWTFTAFSVPFESSNILCVILVYITGQCRETWAIILLSNQSFYVTLWVSVSIWVSIVSTPRWSINTFNTFANVFFFFFLLLHTVQLLNLLTEYIQVLQLKLNTDLQWHKRKKYILCVHGKFKSWVIFKKDGSKVNSVPFLLCSEYLATTCHVSPELYYLNKLFVGKRDFQGDLLHFESINNKVLKCHWREQNNWL